MARFSTRRRSSYGSGGFAGRKGERVFRLFRQVSFFILVAFPVIISSLYLFFVASPQYISEARFSVNVAQIPQLDNLGTMTGIASVAIIRDTQIVTNFIVSRAAVEALERRIALRDRFSAPSIDFWSRFDPTKPVEKFVRYWERQVGVSISMPAGIVNLSVRAFSPQDAHQIARELIQLSEELINEQNDRIFRDAIRAASDELERSAARLTAARVALESARADTGVLDTTRSAEATNRLITESRAQLLAMQQDYASRSRFIATDSPQLRVLAERISALQGQIAELERRLINNNPASDPTISTMMTRFQALDMEKQIAERLYAGATANLEAARLLSEQRRMYLTAFVQPSLPEDSLYPRPYLFTFLITLACLAAWGALVGAATLARNYMA
ncbi:lipopolysaccharide biosynthesis protein [Phreatobacter oligotrophus]|uniref:Capsular polysaccharide transport system permease protein n=1 Tax=Phreatobacter oligotrophus TaxID=1122261 RepID=A0A2T4YLR8_9HYPH|nr:lipopolysaccharide biosynthesis protein [Phreatobacter oligotrophus]PTM44264.1 capsular polysaccharide transport system permease protein [Phreatobacter oligotrophus]